MIGGEEMKNQYFGDINDFRKYGLLRALTGSTVPKKDELSLAVCWMLTPNDNTPHGKRIQYLKLPKIYRYLDFELFDYFVELDIVNEKNRDVKNAQKINCLPITSLFYSEPLPSDKNARAGYFNKFLKRSEEFDILFYDPDIGINVKTHRYGTMYSNKYLYWCELIVSYLCGHSIVFFQHFGMQPGGRDLFINNIAKDLKRSIGIGEIYSFKSAHVVFFLLPQSKHSLLFKEKIEYIREKWSLQAGFNVIKRH
jgi:hypothetical protein